jgi:GT2 family glycosyltransferase
MASPIATIIVPNYNGERFLPRLLDSLERQSRRDFVVLVVDDASTDGSAAWLRSRLGGADKRLRLSVLTPIIHERNLGFASACNTGLRRARTPFVALLNNDTWVDSRWYEAAMRPFDEPTVGAAASLVVSAEPPHGIDSAGDVYSVVGGAKKRLHGAPIERAADLPRETFSACAAAAFYRREALEQVGLLDESFVSYYEDVELGFRLQWAGWRCAFEPDSVCYHHGGSSYHPRGWRMHANSARNAEVVWWSLVPPAVRRRFLPSHVAFCGLQFLHRLTEGRATAYLAGKWNALRRIADIRRKREQVRRIARISDAEMERRLIRDWWGLHIASRKAERPHEVDSRPLWPIQP